jgi:hypothetical protein
MTVHVEVLGRYARKYISNSECLKFEKASQERRFPLPTSSFVLLPFHILNIHRLWMPRAKNNAKVDKPV